MPATLTDLLTRCARSAQREIATDGDLLRRVARSRDADALTELVRRHAGLVWGVCRRRLRNEADAEDAFQATFLALVRQAPRLDADRPLAGWLHTVADRVARKAQARALKRSAQELADPPAEADVPAEVGGREFLAVVDESIARLPDRFREPVVLCCVRGLTRDEAADALGCSVAALKARLERGRRMLRRLLERRGVALPAAFLALGIGTTSVRAALRERAVDVALGQPSPAVAALVTSSATVPWKVGLSLVAAGVIGLTALGLGQPAPPKDAPPPKEPLAAATKEEARPAIDRIGDPLPDAALLRLGTARFRHPGSANVLALTPDEKTVLTLGWEGLYAWDTTTGKEKWRAAGRDLNMDLNVPIGSAPLVVLPDGKRAVSVIRGPGFHVWDLATGTKEVRRFPEETLRRGEYFQSADVSKDGKTLALGGPQGVVLCNLDGKITVRIPGHPGQRENMTLQNRLLPLDGFGYPRFAPDGKSLAVVTSDIPTDVRLCNLDGGEVRRITLTGRYLDSAFSPDGKLLAVAERDDTIRVYETASGQRKYAWPIKITRARANENYIFNVRFSPDGKTVAAGVSDKLIHLWDVPTGKKLAELEGHSWYPTALTFTKDSKTLYSTGWDGEVRRWDLAARKQLPLPQGVRGSAVVAATPDGMTVVYADGGNNLRLVDAKSGDERAVVTIPGLDPDQVAFSADSRQMAVGGKAGDKAAVFLVDLHTTKVIRRFDWPKGNDPHTSVEDLVFAPDGRRLAAMCFRKHAARVWDLTTDKEPLVLKHPEGYSLSFSPDGKTLVTGGWDRMIRFWDPADGRLKKEHPVVLPKDFVATNDLRSDVRVFAVAWSPDGTRIAATDLGMNLWIWDADTMRLRTLTDTKDIPRYRTMAWSPDGLWVATGGASGRVQVWDGWSGQLVWDRGKHGVDVFKVTFGKDNRTLVSGASDGLGYRWDLRPKDLPADPPAALWSALVGSDGPAAYKAYWGMLTQPDAAATAIAEQGKTFTEKVDPAQVRKWIADLDAPRFAAREAAERELAARLRASVPLLRETLAKNPTEEQRARVRKLLDAWEGTRTGRTRAVSVLTHLGTPAAKKVLADWAAADPDGDLGKAAAAALKRD